MDQLKEFLNEVIKISKKKGAHNAETICYTNKSITASTRLGKVENIESSNSQGFGIRLIIDKKHAIVSSNEMKIENVEEMITQAIEIAKLAPPDPYLDIADVDQLDRNIKNYDIYDDSDIEIDKLIENAKKAEDTALSVKNITSSEGSSCGYSKNIIGFASSNDFIECYKTSNHNLSVAVIAGENLNMQTDYESSYERFFSDIKSPEIIGQIAGERTVRKLNPKKIPTQEIPIIFEHRTARSIISNFASAINGSNIAGDSSFLKNMLGKQIFHKDVNILDDATINRAIGSRPFDGEGISSIKKFLVKDGILVDYLLDIRSAKKLNLDINSSAQRTISSKPYPAISNFYLDNANNDVKAVISDIKKGLFITELFGMGVNLITGDYSQGACGFFIENGIITYPVSEITIASNLLEMFSNMIVCNDLDLKYNVNSPTIMIDKMIVAGA